MNRKLLASFIVVGAAGFTGSASADITMNIYDDGLDLYMVASGDFDMSNAVVNTSFSGLGINAVMWPTFPLYGWETSVGTNTGYDVTYTGALTFTGDSSAPADFVSTSTPFFFANFTSQLFLSTDALTGSVDELARFDNQTLADLGMVVGETVFVEWGNGGVNERATINTVLIPAPGAVALLGVAGFAARRRRRA